jgi:hypothetical protein
MTATLEAPRTAAPRVNPPGRNATGALLTILAWVVGVLFVLPVLWMVLTSLHSEENAATNPPSLFAPLTLDGYANFFGAQTGTSPWPSLLNSLGSGVPADHHAPRSRRAAWRPAECIPHARHSIARSWTTSSVGIGFHGKSTVPSMNRRLSPIR